MSILIVACSDNAQNLYLHCQWITLSDTAIGTPKL